MLFHPYNEGSLKQVKSSSNNEHEVDEYEVYALAKRLGITKDEMLDMSFVSLMNILLSSVDAVEDDRRFATQDDINNFKML